MEKGRHTISLGNWPHRIICENRIKLSPISKRILNQTQVELTSILPISFKEFLGKIKNSQYEKQILQEYQYELERRKKQVSILKDIRTGYILGKDYGPLLQGQSKNKQKTQNKQRVKSKEYENQLKYYHSHINPPLQRKISTISAHKQNCFFKRTLSKRQKLQTSELLEKQKEQSQYFSLFKHKNKNLIKYSDSKAQQSTKCHHFKRDSASQKQEYYGPFFQKDQSKIRMKKKSRQTTSNNSAQIQHQLLETVENWKHLDKRHHFQLQSMQDLTLRETGRLCKIQSLQKKAMEQKLKTLKSRLKSNS